MKARAMSKLAEIVLPVGTKVVDIGDVPRIIASAIYPSTASKARVVTGLKKQMMDESGADTLGLLPLTSDPLRDYVSPEERLLEAIYVLPSGTAVPPMTDWAILNLAWLGLPEFKTPLPELAWKAYADAFAEQEVDWRLVPEWDSEYAAITILQLRVEAEQRIQLANAIRAGEITLCSALSLLPAATANEQQREVRFVLVEELRAYAARFGVAVDHAATTNNSDCPDRFSLHWLFAKFDENAGLLAFPDEAIAVLRRTARGDERRNTTSPATSARALVERWVASRKLAIYDRRGDTLGTPLTGIPGTEDLAGYQSLSDNLDDEMDIDRDDLVSLITSERMTVPSFLHNAQPAPASKAEDIARAQWWASVRADEDAPRDPDYDAKYARAWKLHEELDKWERMRHQDDPIRAKLIDTELARIRTQLAELDQPPAQPVSVPTPSVTHRVRNREASILTAEISQAKANAPDPSLVASVWGELTKLAEQKFGVMVGVVPEGIQYRGKKPRDDGGFDVFTLRSLRERMTREAVSGRA